MTDSTSPKDTNPKAAPNVKLIGIILVILVLAAVGLVSAKYLTSDPKKILQDALKKSTQVKSVSFKFTSTDNNVRLNGDVHLQAEALSQIQLELNKLDGKSDENLSIKAVLNKQDAYVGLTYSKMEEILGKEMAIER